MKTSIKFLVAGIILLILPLWIAKLLGIICILGFIFISFKKFLFELIDHIKGTPTEQTKAGGYRGEARRACEKVTPKRKQNATPPWEQ